MKLLNGKLLAGEILADLKAKMAFGEKPAVLAVILVGDDSSSLIYIQKKQEAASFIGAEIKLIQLSAGTDTDTLLFQIDALNNDENITGILVQLPLPESIDRQKIIWAIKPEKDVDGFQINYFRPPAPVAILELLLHYRIPVLRKKIAIIGYGFLVGKPLSVLLKKQGAFVTIVEKGDRDFKSKIGEADIVVSATGVKHIITADLVNVNQTIIDASGVDVDFENIKHKVKYISPPTGGIGPMTVAILMRNLFFAAQKSSK
ncbi:MAG: methylenetetrahydrofolate dehydrogenase (NADP+) / methenyltetrahydrofolate cyclohydrolase [Candidatus Berkelbacteria bacterium Licking1014_85]|uniref:Bifunctional protein FolD n=1 Tax=Candidatus Berkelbacteria bacterium Licking1014_85 TaxID=2017148 RepID=A0A554LGC4_9BACT|nr:MAG: methylenetetrahydrofolate dehydrogenase (NADP+) / methenyltetrahydrofolate cyclohydrolase [Candidatus Berkelbacteria bacterium Licking1014_85]